MHKEKLEVKWTECYQECKELILLNELILYENAIIYSNWTKHQIRSEFF